MPREEDRRSGKFVGTDGCGEQARGKRNEEQRRRARARIHAQYKAVGVALFPKGRMAPALEPQQQRSSMDSVAAECQAG